MEGVRQRQTGKDAKREMQDQTLDEMSDDADAQRQAKKGDFTSRSIIMVFAAAICITALIVMLLPSPIEPKAFSLPDPPEFVGALAPNKKLQKAQRLFEGVIKGPESIDIHNGVLYTGTADGKILKITDGNLELFARFGTDPCGEYEDEPTCGRPLGIRINPNGTMFAIDAYKGLFQIDTKTGDAATLVSSDTVVDKKPLKFINDLDVQTDGIIYFTDTSHKWQRRQNRYAIAEGGDCGRLLWYNPVTRKTKVLLKNLHFANGVQLSPAEDYLLVSETSRARILKYHLKGPKRGKVEIFAGNLPGLPDNIRRSSGGGYWVGISAVRNAQFTTYDFMASRPWLRSLIFKIFDQEILLKFFPTYGLLLELNEDGQIIQSLHDPTGEVIPAVSEVLEAEVGQLYLGSYYSPFIGKLNLY